MQIKTSFSFLTTDNNSSPCVSGHNQTPTHADTHTGILSSCIVNISSHYIGFSCCKQYLKIKNDDFILICTFDGLGIFHLQSSNFEALHFYQYR